MLHGDGRGKDPHGQLDHQEAFGASEGPAVPGMDVRLRDEGDGLLIGNQNNDV